MKYSNIDFDLVGWSEIDKYAIEGHNALFPEYKEEKPVEVKKKLQGRI